MKLLAPAKLNLFLRILGRRPDGYHDLQTLFQKITLFDEVELFKATGIALEVEGEAPGGRENLCFRAAELFFREAAVEGGVFIRLRKRIPPGTGLGGASSDAAAVLQGLSRLYPGHLSPEALYRMGVRLGADVPFFLSPYATALGEGLGERLTPWPTPHAWYVVAVPSFRVSTAWAYAQLKLTKRKRPLNYAPENFYWESLVNDFEALIFEAYPEAAELAEALKAAGALAAHLTGSGSALFGAFRERAEAERAVEKLAQRFPEARFFVVTNLKEGDPCSSIT
ncbi:4-(cytidine 5'-diphospho)-2-C-methyl-D-erythritol kinase [Thermosulfurimonas marina]|uniref:4-diphosphocytidyl-2-C-methyl-D-erythritol kinase n=1 Tax=Thermosulfurimonas marina TaxID=2047767 RepID=A0A6H1WU47_9BACT|nr:4-(cytidine 5'-diphospho)-2-C-methyl-D-erythritol kinase [Thermosulfurimonas marina]QJA06745.1 4-(cytidine 5'-diphospho)-2-C-methyl-D-erythritol kinase [Thermosulfurimonas marina]